MTDDIGHFCWIDLSAHDMKAAAAWYGDLFGWSLGHVDESHVQAYGMLQLGDVTVAGIGQMTDEMKAARPPAWNSYVKVADCAATVARCRELGGEVMFDTQEVGGGMGKLAFLQDPTGAVIALWEGQAGGGGGEPARSNAPGHFCWQELATPDLEAAKAFYGALFGWTLTPMAGPSPTPVAMIDVGDGDQGHMLQMNDEWEGIPPHWSVYFSVADTDATCEKIKATGGKVMVQPTDIPPGRFAVCADPQGGQFHIIALNEA